MNKKAYTTAIITLLVLSTVLAALPLVSALSVTTVTPSSGNFIDDDEITVEGDSTTTGGLIEIYWDYVKAWDGEAGLLGSGYATGLTYEIDVELPEATAGSHNLIVKDVESGESVSVVFTVESVLDLPQDVGIEGDEIAVLGYGFDDDSEITIEYYDGSAWQTLTTSPYTVDTDDLGSFSCTIDIPDDIDASSDNFRATDEGTNTAYATLTVGPYITLSPDEGIIGSSVEITGRGFTEDGTVDIRWLVSGTSSYITVADNYDVDSDGDFTVTITVPSLADPNPGGTDYNIQAIDNDDGSIAPMETFTLTEEASIELSDDTGEVDDTITVTGEWFSEDEDVTVTFDDTEVATDTTDSVGYFSVSFDVPDVSDGTYTITATDDDGVSASETFTVAAAVLIFETRATEYMQNDFLSIYTYSTDEPSSSSDDVYWEITDPDGLLFTYGWFYYYDWVEVNDDDFYMIPYDDSCIYWMALPADAPTGTWNFTVYESASSSADIIATNLFKVTPASTQSIIDSLADLETNITDAITTSQGVIITSLNGLDAELTSISSGIATITTNVGELETTVSALDITSLTSELATIQTDIGTLSTAVSNLDAKVTAIDGDIATVSTTLGTLQGTITSIEGNTASIETDVGTLQADVTDVKGSVDSTPAWIAVVLSLVAAIAAIFAVITIRQKIAG
ncbi:MAG: IPT/TIG domain-containing protein [Candidatus Bathyarchaeota archaeon]|nr:IPT/TIG domain-containing protein [Candidatus Bathyarchaeum sp.]